MKTTWFDRALSHVAPRLAVKRMAGRATFEAFSGVGNDGGSLSPTNRRWSTTPRSADADNLRGLPRQRAESRELRKTNPIAQGAIATNCNRVVGTGLVPVPEPDIAVLGWTEEQAAEWKAAWQREFSMWADSKECTLDGGQTFYERQELVLGSRLESGDCFTILPDGDITQTMPYRLRLQLIEADRCGNPNNNADTATQVAGVSFDARTGAPQKYHVFDRHPGGTSTTGDMYKGQWYEAIGKSGRRRILHHYRPTRPEQTRGVPYLAPVIQAIKDLGLFIETEGGGSPAPVFGADAPTGAADSSDPAGGAEIAMAPGAVIGLAKGEKATFADPKRPNTAYEPFVTGVLKFIGTGLGLPLEVLVKQFNSSYSASKAALLDAWQHFRTERAWLVLSFCQPVYETLMAEAVATGRIQAPGFFEDPLIRWAYTRAAWHGDSQGSINPKDEVAAYTAAVDATLMTRERAEWELFGSDWVRTFPVKRRERDMLKEADMLPAPKPGAAAPAPATPSNTTAP